MTTITEVSHETSMIQRPLYIGGRRFSSSVIQGPLAGFSAAPFRQLFYRYTPPAYTVSEMISAKDVLYKHKPSSRYLYRAPEETHLCYQLSGSDAREISQAAQYLENLGADLIDLNCGCPKPKIRKKGAGSALLDTQTLLMDIISQVRAHIRIPLSVKIRIQGNDLDFQIAQQIEDAGADALIVHGRRWQDDYTVPCDYSRIAKIKSSIKIPVIANGDIHDLASLHQAAAVTRCDGYMIARAGSGQPWLYHQLLHDSAWQASMAERVICFQQHVHALAVLENEYSALLQSKALARYYFKQIWPLEHLQAFYALTDLSQINHFLSRS